MEGYGGAFLSTSKDYTVKRLYEPDCGGNHAPRRTLTLEPHQTPVNIGLGRRDGLKPLDGPLPTFTFISSAGFAVHLPRPRPILSYPEPSRVIPTNPDQSRVIQTEIGRRGCEPRLAVPCPAGPTSKGF